jgi:hypothetical protein
MAADCSASAFYAQANILKEIEAAMEFALDELGVAERLADRLIHIFKDCGIPKFSIPYQ